jgi:thioredoxin reductase (NADPH)
MFSTSDIQDLVIIGGGPAGLSAAINGASELCKVVLCDSGRKNSLTDPISYEFELGGQAKQSSKIENYAGFPDGVTGWELMKRFADQAVRLGTDILCPHHVNGLQLVERGLKLVTTKEGARIITKAVLLANGLSYNKLPARGVKELLGHGVLYGAPTYPASKLGTCTVCIIGGANSAGQAVMHLAENSNIKIKLLVRGKKTIEDQMSKYLVDRIRACANVEVLQDYSVTEAIGTDRLEAVKVSCGEGEKVIKTDHLFIYIGAAPKTEWLNGSVRVDQRSYIATGTDLGTLYGPKLPFETSMPGVFAAGDTRLGSAKRVAAAVGEGSGAVSSVHSYLAQARF